MKYYNSRGLLKSMSCMNLENQDSILFSVELKGSSRTGVDGNCIQRTSLETYTPIKSQLEFNEVSKTISLKVLFDDHPITSAWGFNFLHKQHQTVIIGHAITLSNIWTFIE